MNFFKLTTPQDLFRKMESDLAALRGATSDSYLAFNFFITAEHLPDWLDRRDLVKQTPLLRVVSHLANGAKHFNNLDPKRHASVDSTSTSTYAQGYTTGYFAETLVVQLTSDEETNFGKPWIEVLELAEMIIAFWRPYVS